MAALNDPIFDFVFFFRLSPSFEEANPLVRYIYFFGHKCVNWTVRQQHEDLRTTKKGSYCMGSKEEENRKILSESDKPR